MFLSGLLIMMVSYAQVKNSRSTTVSGTVVDDATGKPVSRAHVYVVRGEEEAITDDSGTFRIESWQKLPITLTVDQPQHRRATVVVAEPGRKQVVRLKLK